ncbi:MAG: gfo/Idh/MocA family oxidoreductase, partial [Spartobacteria bacterium]
VTNRKYPELEDFGVCSLVAENGATGYFRVVWLTPDGLGSWGDGRLIILGTEGYIELRKYIDIATPNGGEQLLLVDSKGEHRIACSGQVGFPFFGELILDCLHRTEKAMTQRHTFLAAELCLKAQNAAMRLDRRPLDATRR